MFKKELKRGQMQSVFLIAFVAIACAFLLIFGYNALKSIKSSGKKAETANFFMELKSGISEISEQEDSVEKFNLKAPSDMQLVCFVSNALLENKELLENYCSNLRDDFYYAERIRICSLLMEGVKKNVFLIPSFENYYVQGIILEDFILCVPTYNNHLHLLLLGLKGNTYLRKDNSFTKICTLDEDCNQDEFCNDKNICVLKCKRNDDCKSEEKVCNFNTGRCVDCMFDEDCDSDLFCSQNNTCIECFLDNDCNEDEICLNNKCEKIRCGYADINYSNGEKFCISNRVVGICEIINHSQSIKNIDCENNFCVNGACENTCNNGILEEWEDCEGDNLRDKECKDLKDPVFGFNYNGGKLSCYDNCSFDVSMCDSPILSYMLNYQDENLLCLLNKSVNKNSQECFSFVGRLANSLCNGDTLYCDSSINFLKEICTKFYGKNNFDLVLFKLPADSTQQFYYNTYNIKGNFGIDDLVISSKIIPKQDYSGEGFVCYDLCNKGYDFLKIFIYKNNKKGKILKVERSSYPCSICRFWLKDHSCESALTCSNQVFGLVCSDNKVCCKTNALCPNNKLYYCSDVCSSGDYVNYEYYCSDGKKCCYSASSDECLMKNGFYVFIDKCASNCIIQTSSVPSGYVCCKANCCGNKNCEFEEDEHNCKADCSSNSSPTPNPTSNSTPNPTPTQSPSPTPTPKNCDPNKKITCSWMRDPKCVEGKCVYRGKAIVVTCDECNIDECCQHNEPLVCDPPCEVLDCSKDCTCTCDPPCKYPYSCDTGSGECTYAPSGYICP
ncbi:MAG: hypothetical protein ACP5H9_01335 [Candidatus Woesearchaeota archaeon]